MNIAKYIGKIALGALGVSLIPFLVKRDREAGTVEVRSLLWGVKKFPGKDKDHYDFAIPPSALDRHFQAAPDEKRKNADGEAAEAAE